MAKDSLASFDYVGFMETFDSDIRTIFADLGAPEAEVPHSNATRDTPTHEVIYSATCARLRALTRLDRRLYDHALQNFAQPRLDDRRPRLQDRLRSLLRPGARGG